MSPSRSAQRNVRDVVFVDGGVRTPPSERPAKKAYMRAPAPMTSW